VSEFEYKQRGWKANTGYQFAGDIKNKEGEVQYKVKALWN
jgi:hypothetical protein